MHDDKQSLIITTIRCSHFMHQWESYRGQEFFNHTTNNTKLLALSWLTHDPADDEKKNRAENILIAFQRTALYGICVQRPSKLVIMKRLELLKHATESNRA